MAKSATLVPLEVWHYNSPELLRAGRAIDVGLIAEALIFYDRVYFAFTNEEQFARLVAWFHASGMTETLISLLDDGTLVPHFYAFSSAAIDMGGVWNIGSIQDEPAAAGPVLQTRILESQRVAGLIRKASVRERLVAAASKHGIEAKASDYGPAVAEARADYQDAERGAFLMQILVDELYQELGFLKSPVITATVSERNGLRNITWNQNFAKLFARLGPTLPFTPGVPLSGAASCSKVLWSAARLDVDLYVGAPLSEYVRAKVHAGNRAAKAQAIVEEIVVRAQFPDVRALVIRGVIGPEEVLALRSRAKRFRAWLSTEKHLDRDAVLAYLGQLSSEAGWRKDLGKVIGAIGLVGGAVVGAATAGPLGAVGGALVGSGSQYVLQLAERIAGGWSPVVFGNTARAHIERASRS